MTIKILFIFLTVCLYLLLDHIHFKVKKQEKEITELKVKIEQIHDKSSYIEETLSSNWLSLNNKIESIENYLTEPGK